MALLITRKTEEGLTLTLANGEKIKIRVYGPNKDRTNYPEIGLAIDAPKNIFILRSELE